MATTERAADGLASTRLSITPEEFRAFMRHAREDALAEAIMDEVPDETTVRREAARGFADDLGLTREIAHLAARGFAPAVTAATLGERLGLIGAVAGMNGEDPKAATTAFVRDIEADLAIPPEDAPWERDAWRERNRALAEAPSPDAAPAREPDSIRAALWIDLYQADVLRQMLSGQDVKPSPETPQPSPEKSEGTAVPEPDRAVEPDRSRDVAPEKPKALRSYAGRLIAHGPAPYQNDPEASLNYFVTLDTGRGEKTVWGVDLERAVEDGAVRLGDHIAVEHYGSQTVTVTRTVVGRDGKPETHDIQVQRNAWSVEKAEPAPVPQAPETAATTPPGEDDKPPPAAGPASPEEETPETTEAAEQPRPAVTAPAPTMPFGMSGKEIARANGKPLARTVPGTLLHSMVEPLRHVVPGLSRAPVGAIEALRTMPPAGASNNPVQPSKTPAGNADASMQATAEDVKAPVSPEVLNGLGTTAPPPSETRKDAPMAALTSTQADIAAEKSRLDAIEASLAQARQEMNAGNKVQAGQIAERAMRDLQTMLPEPIRARRKLDWAEVWPADKPDEIDDFTRLLRSEAGQQFVNDPAPTAAERLSVELSDKLFVAYEGDVLEQDGEIVMTKGDLGKILDWAPEIMAKARLNIVEASLTLAGQELEAGNKSHARLIAEQAMLDLQAMLPDASRAARKIEWYETPEFSPPDEDEVNALARMAKEFEDDPWLTAEEKLSVKLRDCLARPDDILDWAPGIMMKARDIRHSDETPSAGFVNDPMTKARLSIVEASLALAGQKLEAGHETEAVTIVEQAMRDLQGMLPSPGRASEKIQYLDPDFKPSSHTEREWFTRMTKEFSADPVLTAAEELSVKLDELLFNWRDVDDTPTNIFKWAPGIMAEARDILPSNKAPAAGPQAGPDAAPAPSAEPAQPAGPGIPKPGATVDTPKTSAPPMAAAQPPSTAQQQQRMQTMEGSKPRGGAKAEINGEVVRVNTLPLVTLVTVKATDENGHKRYNSISAFGDDAKKASALKEGDAVYVKGRVTEKSFEKPGGTRSWRTDIVVGQIEQGRAGPQFARITVEGAVANVKHLNGLSMLTVVSYDLNDKARYNTVKAFDLETREAMQALALGHHVRIEGGIGQNSYEKNGEKVYGVDLVADSVTKVDPSPKLQQRLDKEPAKELEKEAAASMDM